MIHLRSDLADAKSFKKASEKELEKLMIELHSCQLQLQRFKVNQTVSTLAYASSFITNSPNSSSSNSSTLSEENVILIQKKLENELTKRFSEEDKNFSSLLLKENLDELNKENQMLKEQIVNLSSEVYGARLAAKYLDKELAGRIQQIQLFDKNLKIEEHERLWNQLEAEIHLHRHKTVIRACRSKRRNERIKINEKSPTATSSPLLLKTNNELEALKKNNLIGQIRIVNLVRQSNSKEGLGISITGGKEHGVPILISEIHTNGPAARSGELFVGDAILSVNEFNLKEALHSEAVEILSHLVILIMFLSLFIL